MKFKFQIGDILEANFKSSNGPIWQVNGYHDEDYKLHPYNWGNYDDIRSYKKVDAEKQLRISTKEMKKVQWNKEMKEILKA